MSIAEHIETIRQRALDHLAAGARLAHVADWHARATVRQLLARRLAREKDEAASRAFESRIGGSNTTGEGGST